jgi:hypothetical protein
VRNHEARRQRTFAISGDDVAAFCDRRWLTILGRGSRQRLPCEGMIAHALRLA